jgi:putative DNA primase/helicase
MASVFNYDLQLIDQLQEFMGYCLVSDVTLQKFAAFTGKSRAGKGTITSVIRTMVGEHNTTAPTLSNLVRDSSLHKMSTASLGLIPDAHSVSVNKREEVLGMFKAITGGDPIEYHVMYKGVQDSVFKIKMILSTNGMPEFNDPSGALVNRMLCFPFYNSVAGREDPKLGQRLMAEISGIAQWSIAGLNRLRRNDRLPRHLPAYVRKNVLLKI